jgi:hypothetical protein
VFDLDLEHCPNCGGELKIIAAILEQPVIEKLLTRLYLLAGVARDLSADTTDGDVGAHLDFTLQPVLRPRLRVADWVRERYL